MRIDWYTKAVLTVIAVALVAIAAEDYVVPAQAQLKLQKVQICSTVDCARVVEGRLFTAL